MNKLATLLFIALCFLLSSCSNYPASSNIVYNFKKESIEQDSLTLFLEELIEKHNVTGLSFALLNEGHTVYNLNTGHGNLETLEFINDQSIFEAASLSKPVFAYFVLKLSERGVIDLNRPLALYLSDPEMEVDARYRNVTAGSVLNHTTGFPNWRWFDAPPDSLDINRGEFYMISDPGSRFTYSGEGFDYLARVIAHNAGLSMNELDELFKEIVNQPLGIEHFYFTWDEHLYDHKVYGHIDGLVNNRNWGSGLPYQNSMKFNAAGGLHTNAVGYAKFIEALIFGKGLLPNTHAQLLTPSIEVSTSSKLYEDEGITHWGLGIGVAPLGQDTIYRHGGSHDDFRAQMAFSIRSKFGYTFFVNCNAEKAFEKELANFFKITN